MSVALIAVVVVVVGGVGIGGVGVSSSCCGYCYIYIYIHTHTYILHISNFNTNPIWPVATKRIGVEQGPKSGMGCGDLSAQ